MDPLGRKLSSLHIKEVELSASASSASPPASGEPDDVKSTIRDLLTRCKTLQAEVETYVAVVAEAAKVNKEPSRVEYNSLRSGLKNEISFLQKLADDDIDGDKAHHSVVSCNFPNYEALWNAAKDSESILAFRKYFHWGTKSKEPQTKQKTAAVVDIVAKEGLEWVRVSTTSEKRLVFDLAKLGWHNDSDEDEDEENVIRPDPLNEEDDEDEIPLVRNARELARAARANPVRGKPPQVRFVLTRIESGKTKEIDTILDKIKATGAIVQCTNDLTPPLPLPDALPSMLIDRSRNLTETLNIDCTILLALISDISHHGCPIMDWYPGEVRAQIKDEEKVQLLPTHLYPAIGSHPMVCTQDAADQMNLIVDTLATDTEKLRADLLLGQRKHASTAPDELCKIWKSLSTHPVPEGFQLPIKVEAVKMETLLEKLPKAAATVATELASPLNASIFFYGWAEGHTTMSSNRTRAKQIEHLIDQIGLQEGEMGPHIWICEESRSLIAKQGRRKGTA